METLYLHPGYNLLLEWGHALYIDNKTGKKGVQKPKQNPNSICKSKNQKKIVKDKTENGNKVSDKTQNGMSIMDMIQNMNPGQTSKSEQHVKEVQVTPMEDETHQKG